MPWPVQRATAAAAPNSMSSGWATIAIAFDQSSGRVFRGSRSMVRALPIPVCLVTRGSARVRPWCASASSTRPTRRPCAHSGRSSRRRSAHDRQHAIPRTLGRGCWAMVAHPSDWYQPHLLLVARDGRRTWSALADLGGSRPTTFTWRTSRSTCVPERRRRGHRPGAARRGGDADSATRGRTSVCGEVYVPSRQRWCGRRGVRVRHVAMGFEACTPRTTCCSPLPVGPDARRACAARPTRRLRRRHLDRPAVPRSTSTPSARCAPG